jgi:hypothetical protein
MNRMRRLRKEPAIVCRQRCPSCGSLLPTNARVPFAEPGGSDILLQRFAGRGRIENVRSLSYLADGPFEKAYRMAWIQRLRLALDILTGRVRSVGAAAKRYSGTGPGRVEELPPASVPGYRLTDLTVRRFDGQGSP